MANALPLLCPDGAVGVAVAARDEAVQLRPLDERHHQGGGEASIMTNRRPVAAPGSTGSLGGMLAPRLGDPLSGGRPRGQLAQYKIAPRRDSGKLLLVLDCGR